MGWVGETGSAWGAGADFGVGGTLLFRVRENRKQSPAGRGIRAGSIPRGAPCAGREPGAPAGQAVPAQPLSPALGSCKTRRNCAPAREREKETCAHPREDVRVASRAPPRWDRRAGTAWSSEAKAKQSLGCPCCPQGILSVPQTTRKWLEMALQRDKPQQPHPSAAPASSPQPSRFLEEGRIPLAPH